MISDLDESLGVRYFLNGSNERTCFASCACAFKSSGFIWNTLKRLLYFCHVWMKLMEVAKRFCQCQNHFEVTYSFLKRFIVVDFTAWLWGWNVRVNEILSSFSGLGRCIDWKIGVQCSLLTSNNQQIVKSIINDLIAKQELPAAATAGRAP